MALCSSSSLFSFSDACVRELWSVLLPSILVIVFCLRAISWSRPEPLTRIIEFAKNPFHTFLSLSEAEDLCEEYASSEESLEHGSRSALSCSILLSSVALLETLAWMAVGTFGLVVSNDNEDISTGDAIYAICLALTWLYASISPVLNPSATASYDLFALYAAHLFGATFLLGGHFFDYSVHGCSTISIVSLAAYIANLTAICFLLLVMLSRPLAIPRSRIDKEAIGKTVSPEYYTTLWGWISFNWVGPLVQRGTYGTLNEDDVWQLSVTMKAKPVFLKFSEMKRRTIIGRLWEANSFDLMIDGLLNTVSVFLTFASPYFLKKILDAIDHPSQEAHARAYVYACLAFCATITKAETDLIHLWFLRRAATRMSTELMVAIYDKALKRKDLSGVARKEENKSVSGRDADSGNTEKDKTSNAGADVGKIVNMMSGDVDRITLLVTLLYYVYSAPFEIVISCIFLYNLLGVSAFAGFLVLLLSWPATGYITNRYHQIQKDVVASRDKRLSLLNELVGSVKFVKFFAWEDRWIQKTLDARSTELKHLLRHSISSVVLRSVWTIVPVLVSTLSFLMFVAMGNELTIGKAFTAITLFNMLRSPLNAIPIWTVQVAQCRVALQRIDDYLNEPEVDENVSAIKRAHIRTEPQAEAQQVGFGLKNASFRWNSSDNDDKEPSGKKASSRTNDEVDEEVSADAMASDSDAGSRFSDGEHDFELRDLTVFFPEGELTVVTGPTASGKTALLLALLGEMTMLPGGETFISKEPTKVENGFMLGISYAAQSPWLQHQSIKENIIFGSPRDEERYAEVVECCALLPDFQMLEDGDQTEIGARGVSLSGGQKARVALARAVYARMKYVLLDDPLSAVDSHTSRFLYERLFQGPLLKHRTVVLVTHHVELVLPGAYYLIRMLDGRIDVQGTVKDLRARGVLEQIALESEAESKMKEKEKGMQSKDKIEPELVDPEEVRDRKVPRKLVRDEEREAGSVKWNVYKTYLKASSYWTWALVVFIGILVQIISVGDKYWIMIWGEAYGDSGESAAAFHIITPPSTELPNTIYVQGFTAGISSSTTSAKTFPPAQDNPLFYVGIYAAIGLLNVVFTIASMSVQFYGGLQASRRLFKRLLESVVRATMRWHDTTPTGRMLNRFSKDIETIDMSLAFSLQTVNFCLTAFASSMIVIVAILPLFTIPAIAIGYFYYRFSIGYLNTGRDLRRMESTTRSPIFSGFSELLEGVVTVRAFSSELCFLKGFFEKVDLMLRFNFAVWMTNRWLLVRFDCLGGLGVFVTTLFAIYSSSGMMRTGLAALCITSAMTFTNNVYWACRFYTQVELDMNSVERVVEYLELPQEPPSIITNSRPPAHWPSCTGPNRDSLLVVDRLEVRYAPDLPAVLRNVCFTLKANERVGLLGRTGSGKSTLAMSMLRFVDPSAGRILIDGIDITSIGVNDLRSRLTFIPQDATLFSGSLRDNLDPFGDFSDVECVDALRRVHLITSTEGTPVSQLSSSNPSRAGSIHEDVLASSSFAPSIDSDAPSSTAADGSSTGSGSRPTTIRLGTGVSAGGQNFSAGQRQLIALARALLRRSTVIILDEATSSIDFETDERIQHTIRNEFVGSLLLTVAHRLRTIIDYDRLIVLDAGEIVEFDTPLKLIQKEGGVFREMCLKSGNFAELERTAMNGK